MGMGARGLTLLETVVSSALVLIVVLIAGTATDSLRPLERQLRLDLDHMRAAASTAHIAKRLEGADRLNLVPASGLYQIRTLTCPPGIPAPGCFDTPANYHWHQYRLSGEELRFYTNTEAGCGSMQVLAKQIQLLSFAFVNEEPLAPPGGEPPNQDNNVVEYRLRWSHDGRSQEFVGEETIRAGAYTNIATGLQAPWLGDVSPPPAACP